MTRYKLPERRVARRSSEKSNSIRPVPTINHQALVMPRVTCRCGERLKVQPDGPERIECPRCGAKIRLRHTSPRRPAGTGDGFLRFLCPCGRRLKVPAADRPVAGRCPDCGRIVPGSHVFASQIVFQLKAPAHPKRLRSANRRTRQRRFGSARNMGSASTQPTPIARQARFHGD